MKFHQLCLVNRTNVLWTCHKACKIEFDYCSFSLCSVYYANKVDKSNKLQERVLKKSRKRRGGTRSLDENLALCNHSIDAMVGSNFFSAKYKDTIQYEKYTLPLRCSGCKGELVDKIRNDGGSNLLILSKYDLLDFVLFLAYFLFINNVYSRYLT